MDNFKQWTKDFKNIFIFTVVVYIGYTLFKDQTYLFLIVVALSIFVLNVNKIFKGGKLNV